MIVNLFTTFIYQPFLNILVGSYWLLGFVSDGKPDMGIAVIILTIIIRILLLPMSLAGDRSEKERREIAAKIKEIESNYEADPIVQRKERRIALRKSRGVLAAEIINLFIQVAIALMLWRIFAKGLEGQDLHLIYSFMPKIDTPFNLVFLGKYDLTHTNFVLNLVQSGSIFLLETLQIMTSAFPHSRSEVVRMQLVLPVVAFLVFMGLPAGKKLFVITTLWFSIGLTIFKFLRRKYLAFRDRWEEKEAAEEAGEAPPAGGQAAEEKIVVETK